MFKSTDYNSNKYTVYKKLALQGYRLVRYTEICKRKSKSSKHDSQSSKIPIEISKKRKIEGDEEIDIKKGCSRQSKNQNQEREFINSLFEEMQKKVPVEYSKKSGDIEVDYCVFVSNNKSRTEYDFNLSIW